MSERPKFFSSMLLCADRSGEAQVALRKASIIARYLGADIELFACDADHAWAVAHAADDIAARAELTRCLAASRRYLVALRGSIAASDLRLTTRAACAGTFVEGVAERLREGRHDLVVKNLGDGLAEDLALAQVCRVPLLLTRSRPWRPAPRIWVALDLAGREVETDRRAVDIARALARACEGSFRLVYSRPRSPTVEPTSRLALRAAGSLGVAADEVRMLDGDPRETLPASLRDGEVDLLVVAQARASRRERRGRSVTESLLGPEGCDVMVVPSVDAGSVGRVARDLAPLREDASDRHA